MKKFLLFLVAVILCACSNDKVAGISTVETENAYLIRVVHEDSLPAVGVLARMRAASFVRSVENDSAGAAYYEEFVTDSLGCIRVDSLAVDVATIEIVTAGEGVFDKIAAEDVQNGDSVQFVLKKTGSMRGRVYLPEGVDHAWIQVYGTDRLVKTDSEGFYEIDSLPAYDYDLRVVVGDSVVEQVATVGAGEATHANVRTFEPDSVKVLDFESADAQFIIRELGISEAGYMSSTDTSVKTTPEVATVPETREDIEEFFVEAGADRAGNALHWVSSAGRGRWSFYGIWVCPEESPCDLSATDSIVFYARGNGVISITLETLGSSNEEGKTLAYDTLNTDGWVRRVIKPANFKPRDDMYGNLGWDVISKAVTTISIASYDETEFWIDDVVFYGVKPSDFIAK
ncbi:MAG: carboxypeptidase regulatory-like domain-containing protein [Fibrobacter sp.]|nr:carboxypeptidase regulatory-like domain-containing protein [Fibrobacter sp.]